MLHISRQYIYRNSYIKRVGRCKLLPMALISKGTEVIIWEVIHLLFFSRQFLLQTWHKVLILFPCLWLINTKLECSLALPEGKTLPKEWTLPVHAGWLSPKILHHSLKDCDIFCEISIPLKTCGMSKTWDRACRSCRHLDTDFGGQAAASAAEPPLQRALPAVVCI